MFFDKFPVRLKTVKLKKKWKIALGNFLVVSDPLKALREAIVIKMRGYNGISADPDSDIP